MNYYFETINLEKLNIFNHITKVGHVEQFLAVKDMKLGDLVF